MAHGDREWCERECTRINVPIVVLFCALLSHPVWAHQPAVANVSLVRQVLDQDIAAEEWEEVKAKYEALTEKELQAAFIAIVRSGQPESTYHSAAAALARLGHHDGKSIEVLSTYLADNPTDNAEQMILGELTTHPPNELFAPLAIEVIEQSLLPDRVKDYRLDIRASGRTALGAAAELLLSVDFPLDEGLSRQLLHAHRDSHGAWLLRATTGDVTSEEAQLGSQIFSDVENPLSLRVAAGIASGESSKVAILMLNETSTACGQTTQEMLIKSRRGDRTDLAELHISVLPSLMILSHWNSEIARELLSSRMTCTNISIRRTAAIAAAVGHPDLLLVATTREHLTLEEYVEAMAIAVALHPELDPPNLPAELEAQIDAAAEAFQARGYSAFSTITRTG